MRGRNGGGGNNNNNNRKGPNPLNRNYESNGPDVKIRGSAQQIAEKYATLARDAMSSGDRVMAENYLQHAEHYNRIIAAAQAQMPIQHTQHRNDEFDDELDEEFEGGAEAQAPSVNHGTGPQPVIEGVPAEVALNAESGRESRDGNGQGRHRDRRHQNGRRSEFGQNGPRDEQQAKQDGGSRDNVGHDNAVQDSAPQDQGGHDQGGEQAEAAQAPEPVAVEAPPAAVASAPAPEAASESDEKPAEEAAPRRARRPRRPRVSAAKAGETAEAAEEAGVTAEG
ncbi:DUF4167 domain-containing protein [Aquamicrobium terrae]